MKKYFKYSLALTLLFSSISHAAVLVIPSTVELMALNGQKVKLDLEQKDIDIHQGKNQIVYRYVEILKDGSKQRKFQSSPLVSIINVPKDEDVYLSHKSFSSYTMASVAFRTNKVKWAIHYSDGSSKSLTPDELPGNEGLFPYANLESLIEKYNISHNIDIFPAALATQDNATKEREQIKINTNSDKFIKEIKSWYINASDIERKSLLKWMIEQN